MPVLTGTVSVAANATSANLVTGELYEFLGEPSVVNLFVASAATGLNGTLLIGAETVIDDQLASHANRFPISPDDFLGRGGGLPGDRLVLRFRNTTGGALVLFWRLEIDPV
jgi:hypothetical protein